METIYRKAENALDELLGIDPGASGAPEKIFTIVSRRFCEMQENGECHGDAWVDLTFGSESADAEETLVEITYSNAAGSWDLEEVKKDCAALARLGFDVLQVCGS